jgi:hypothetical protein
MDQEEALSSDYIAIRKLVCSISVHSTIPQAEKKHAQVAAALENAKWK